MIRRTINLILLGLAFYGGTQVERGLLSARCTNAGGEVNARNLCVGLPR
ncbi:MAG: hypothetical protein AAGA12_00820 [Pseudomonadota bacterium]